MRVTSLLILAVLIAPAIAAGPASNGVKSKTPASVPAPPPPPENYSPPAAPELPDAGQPEPEITITTKGTEIHHEYRLNGRLYMIKIIPAKGKPYYLIDHEGSGQFRRSDFESRIAIPTWVIKRF
ncbi:MAG: hypothetical protein A3E57_08045 [Candidatus Muproteobacteria bacterium RIFCSPHIGHO2_12_FULL_60_33]|uniref:DUF2782 domain-containing protein n=1 Tax=Candidatus Muproteobacteria bacterium RIFCSPLOWO2_01_FULL_60_18 TaxID=1817768 RepID=A0A1F6U5G5_9PROT|nr:MAG: hypothetical protein A3A87_02235 [Candidatus Muproteobacteria bacterium RIFCSPLOWO2_01_FULL_60_18]OGI53075.1 MAG: hypothetical protein A2W42_02710 [Candidatus Muproteobacteria bacterium RIFCSPHIGHO2_01_60_12]OGI54311.1 MAG: hypothetical protein A3E57_08045 [Candidatus Muproteobacteria bacterium RIFCSPHIGHO2_12_FULL_60_33]OGI55862.1 MAG: hypothetical protein A3D32_07470 [Candidatus Muproteobacteria bacterium RIFCSPHIGHO2_02_FULL_60_13]OGI59316.1 MAG: hypothetical protein A2809_01345 [Can